jgi:hypothetical protein
MSKKTTQWLFCYWDEPEFNYKSTNKKNEKSSSSTSRDETLNKGDKTRNEN